MHRSHILGQSVALGAGVALGPLLATNLGYANGETVYAVDATPSPTVTTISPLTQTSPTPALVATLAATPTAVAQLVVPPPSGGAASPLQQASDQIGTVSQQVAQAVQDPSLTTDAKVERINSLAAQFNQLVAQWQQQVQLVQLATRVMLARRPWSPSRASR